MEPCRLKEKYPERKVFFYQETKKPCPSKMNFDKNEQHTPDKRSTVHSYYSPKTKTLRFVSLL